MSVEIKIVDAPVTVKTVTPSEYQPLVKQLDEAGWAKVAEAEFPTEAEALAFLTEVQRAANQLDRTAMKRYLKPVVDAKGKPTEAVVLGVSVRAKITRQKKEKVETPVVHVDGDAAAE